MNFEKKLLKRYIFSYNYYKYILLDYGLGLELGHNSLTFIYKSIIIKINLGCILGRIFKA